VADIALRDYQAATLDRLRDGFREKHRIQMLYAPTGAGKTEMAISLMDATAKKGNRAAMVLDRIVLCNQTSERLQKYGIDHGVMQSGHWRHRPYERIQVCSAQTLEKRGRFPDLDLIIIDEAHTVRRQTIEFLRNNPHIRAVGLSASPFSNGLGSTYTNVVSVTTTKQLVEGGNLVPLRVFVCKEADMTGAKKVAGEWSVDDAGKAGMQITGDVVAEWVKKTHEIFGGPRKTIVFCANVAHGADLAQQFAAAGYNFVPISYRDTDGFKAEAVADFSRPDTSIHGLIACDILTKGFDNAAVEIGVSARPFSKSFASHVQQMGRVMRSHPGKEFALWLDFSGNFLRFREDWEELYENGVDKLEDGRETPKKEKTEKEKEAAKCPACGHLWGNKALTCAHCGYARKLQSTVETVAGELVELGATANKKVPKELKQRWYSELLAYTYAKGYKVGFAATKYRDKFGVWPVGLERTPAPISVEVAGWLRSQQIAFAKSRAR